MRMTPGKRIGGLAFGLAGLIGLSALALFSRAAEQQGQTRLDCGVNALFVLLRLEGRPISYDRLESALPPRQPDGYSMAELSAAARSLGLPLDGVKFVKGDKPLDRPVIAFFQNTRGGHFTVLRPVGTTGTMVQVSATSWHLLAEGEGKPLGRGRRDRPHPSQLRWPDSTAVATMQDCKPGYAA
ncbi:MAG: cysteine peptidase family C39 domain-containing protein [Isosphaeraceae bacterium]